MRMKDKVAVVTGSAQGIGATYVRALAAEGARVVISDILDGTPLAEELTAAGHDVAFIRADVSDEASVAALMAGAVDRFGRIDVLVSNAAIYAALPMQRFEDIPVAEWDKVMSVNVRGAFLCARAVAPIMRRQGYGRIVQIGSATVFKGTPGFLHYVASKGAILAMTRVLAREFGPDGITVNTIAPGFVLSEGVVANADLVGQLTGPVMASRAIKRGQQTDDLIGTLLFLSSDDAAFMTGQCLVVDGGSVTH